ncbi:cation:proton antiporter [Rhodococcus sp. ACT016]|uniref:cation:proton antiporter n=1 Tax=Rhodococcus sp. ACT016 TaxID=3134808 RepID=UPI003D28D267
MDLTLVAVVGVISIVAVAAFSQRMGVAAPLSLLVVGIGLSYVPGLPDVHVEPEWILAGVLPPLLYSAAVTMPAQDFRRNFKAISGLAVLLVVVTTLAAGALFYLVMPGLGWPAAFALGAVVSSTDAVAATSLGRKLGLPSRLLAVLEGEGLINDASALVLLRSAVAAMAGAVSLWQVAGDFVYSVVVAIVIGAVVGYANVHIRRWFNDTIFNTSVSFVIPFLAFVPTEKAGASGVLAVVVTGLVTGHLSHRYLRAQDRISEDLNWRTVAFLLESAVFLLMGLSIESLVDEVRAEGLSLGESVLIGLLTAASVVAIRMIFVIPLVASLRRDERRAAARAPRYKRWSERLDMLGDDAESGNFREDFVARRVRRTTADIDFVLTERLGLRGGVILAWAGMRGAVTLAAAQTLPLDTPYRAELILVAFVVAVTTLLVQGLSLPLVIRWVKVPGDDADRLSTEFGNLLGELADAADAALDSAEHSDPEIVALARDHNLIGRHEVRGGAVPDPEHDLRYEEYLRLRLEALAAEREHLLGVRARGTYSSRAISAANRRLDLEDARLGVLSRRLTE